MAKGFFLLFLGSFLVFGFAFAQEVPEGCEDPGPRPKETTVSSWTVQEVSYQCGNNECGGSIKQRTIEAEESTRTFHTLEEDENHCPAWEEHVVTRSTGATRTSVINTSLGKYQACPESANNVWSTNIPAQCAGKCYPAPKTLPLTHESLQPKNIFDTSGKPKLPLNISWEENVEQELASSPCAVENYSYTIGPVTSTTQENQAVPGGNQCALTPNTSYEFSVKACANNTCGKASDKLSLTTSNALQLLSPYDPDWEEKEGGISPLPVTLQWCPHPEANSYHAQAYKVDPGSHERGEQVLSQGTSKNALKYSDSPERGGLGVFLAGDLLQPLSSLYEWEVFPCTGLNLQGCGLGSQAWRLLPGGEFEKPILQAPADNAVVNMQDSLSWNFVAFASRYVVRLSGDVSGNKDVFVPGTPRLLLGNIWSKLKFDSLYSWSVAACGGAPESKELTGCGSFSDEKRAFRTTGATPTGLSVSPLQNGRTAVPVTFDWDDKDGAASYKLQIGSEESFNVFTPKESRVLVGYPALAPNASQPNASFAWRVRTCADEFGTVCGEWASGSFVLAQLQAPTLTKPDTSQTEFPATTEFAWSRGFGSNFFSWSLALLTPQGTDLSPLCKTAHTVAESIISGTETSIRLRCLGEYEFSVSACVDGDCKVKGPETTRRFTVQSFSGKAGGLVPCDASKDNPATVGFYENEPCELRHLVLLARNLVDFTLWKLSLILVVLMTAFTGFTMYTSFGGMEVAAKARSMWRAVGIGFLILLFSWVFLNLLLGLLGFNVNIFGIWHEVSF